MTNDEDSGGGGKPGSDSGGAGKNEKKASTDSHPNGDAGFGNGSSGGVCDASGSVGGGIGSAGSGSDESSDHIPLETDALQPKMVKSKSSSKVKESKEVCNNYSNCLVILVFI